MTLLRAAWAVVPFVGLSLSCPNARAAEPDSDDDAEGSSSDHAKEDAPKKEHEESKSKPEDHESGEDDAYGHFMQFGIRAGLALGYKIDFRYPHSPLCKEFDKSKPADEQQKVCGFGMSPATELALSFAVLDGIEPYIFTRLGFSGQSNSDTNALRMFGIGTRIYTMSDSRFKMFFEPGIAWETEGGGGNPAFDQGVRPEYKKDMVFHLGIGPQYDVAKAVGIYLNGALDAGIFRSMSTVLLANLGVQIRFP